MLGRKQILEQICSNKPLQYKVVMAKMINYCQLLSKLAENILTVS